MLNQIVRGEQNVRDFLNSKEPQKCILKVTYQRKGITLNRYGVFDFYSHENDQFRIKIGLENDDLHAVNIKEVVIISEISFAKIVDFLNEYRQITDRLVISLASLNS